MNRFSRKLSSSRRRRSVASLIEGMERRLLYSTTVLNTDGSVMGQLEADTGPIQYATTPRKRGSASSDGAPGYQITLVFGGGLSGSQQDTFRAAAARWERVLTADLPDAY